MQSSSILKDCRLRGERFLPEQVTRLMSKSPCEALMEKKILKQEHLDDALSVGARLDLDAAQTAGAGRFVTAEEWALRRDRATIMETARAEAELIRGKARALYAEVEARVKAAEEKGLREGREEGLASVTESLTRINSENEKIKSELERETVKLVYEIARKIIGDAFKTDDDALVGMIRQSLSASLGNELTVLVNPADFERIKDSKPKLIAALHGGQVLNLKPVESVKPNCCLVESELGSVEANLEMQLTAIGRALEVEE